MEQPLPAAPKHPVLDEVWGDVDPVTKNVTNYLEKQIGWTIVDPVTGKAYNQSYASWVAAGVMPANLTWGEALAGQLTWGRNAHQLALKNAALTDTGPGGTGSGAIAPTYRAPDERLIKEAVEGAMNRLVGRILPGMTASLLRRYQADDKRNFNSPTQAIDPMASVYEMIRATGDYRAIHTNRPTSTDEETWISSRVAMLINAGVSPKLAAQLGISQATAAASQDAVQAGGEVANLQSTGRMLDSHKAKLRESIYAVAGLA